MRAEAGRYAARLAGSLGFAFLLAAGVGPLDGQEPPTPAEIERVEAVQRAVETISSDLGDDLWPGFRPDRNPVLYSGLGGGILVGWPGELPEGFRALDGRDGVAWSPAPTFPPLFRAGTTFTSLAPKYSLPAAAALAVHEHFHAHQRERARAGAAFGRSERPAGVRVYPAFDTVNAALLALEGRILASSLETGAGPRSGRGMPEARAREFLAVRRRRRASLLDQVNRWEQRLERNEGLADYVAVRALRWLSRTDHRGWGDEARAELDRRRAWLRGLVTSGDSSLRRRHYATGSAIALALDALAPRWPRRMTAGDRSLEGLLAEALEPNAGEIPSDGSFRRAARREGLAELRGRVASHLAGIAGRRAARVDSLLGRSGTVLRLEAGDPATICGLDPLNVRHVDRRRVLHGGFLRVCGPDEAFVLRARGPTLEDLDEGSFSVPVRDRGEAPVVTAAGDTLGLAARTGDEILEAVTVDASGVSIRADRAYVVRRQGELIVRPVR